MNFKEEITIHISHYSHLEGSKLLKTQERTGATPLKPIRASVHAGPLTPCGKIEVVPRKPLVR